MSSSQWPLPPGGDSNRCQFAQSCALHDKLLRYRLNTFLCGFTQAGLGTLILYPGDNAAKTVTARYRCSASPEAEAYRKENNLNVTASPGSPFNARREECALEVLGNVRKDQEIYDSKTHVFKYLRIALRSSVFMQPVSYVDVSMSMSPVGPEGVVRSQERHAIVRNELHAHIEKRSLLKRNLFYAHTRTYRKAWLLPKVS